MDGSLLHSKRLGLVAGPLAFFLASALLDFEGLSPEGHRALACAFWVAIWWITEALPLAATSLAPVVLFPLSGAMGLSETTEAFGHKYIFLYIGGFMLAIAIERWDLHKRIALTIISLIGTKVKSIVLGFMVATGFLSMWISNTATSVMMLPIGMAIVTQFREHPDSRADEASAFGKMLMLAIAYSASLGGLATLIGTPPNLVFAGVVKEQYDVEITFAQWIVIGLPVSAAMIFICWQYLTGHAFTLEMKTFPGGQAEIRKRLDALGPVSREELYVLTVFALTAFAWISRSFLIEPLVPAIDDTIIAVVAGLSLFVLPAKDSEGQPRNLLTWEEALKLPWGILLLFGGGLALAQAFKVTGLALWIGSQLSLLEGVALIVMIVVLVAAVNFLTEITSNLATTAMILPILAPLAVAVDVHPYMLMVGATVAASCAFMLPVATPPNAVVFGSGHLTVYDMAKAGVWMNLLSILILTAVVYLWLPFAWGLDPVPHPAAFE